MDGLNRGLPGGLVGNFAGQFKAAGFDLADGDIEALQGTVQTQTDACAVCQGNLFQHAAILKQTAQGGFPHTL